ncbi:MAG: hypothetical protein LBL52_02555 [Rickettsiales bacterium]|jgi:hypothetical protein|nr:hypothetical protein [Rickettsiales bacterium]
MSIKVKAALAFMAFAAIPPGVSAQGTSDYYDSFYSDYYKSYPVANKPQALSPSLPRNMEFVSPGSVPAQDVGRAAPLATPVAAIQEPAPMGAPTQAGQPVITKKQVTYKPPSEVDSHYKSVTHDTKTWDVELLYQQGWGQFSFLMDVGSILNWDESSNNQAIVRLSRDFLFKNRQIVFSASFGQGKLTTDRTSDDDIFNELHLISLGKGNANLQDWSVSLGLRNWTRWAGWDITPMIGLKKKIQKFEMYDHVAPAPFYFEALCYEDDYGTCADIDLTNIDGIDYSDLVYIYDDEGEYWYVDMSAEDQAYYNEGGALLTIPGWGYDAEADADVENMFYGMLIPEDDFCYYTVLGDYACLANEDNSILYAFGGVSSLNEQWGITHIYYVTWYGPFLGMNFERAISPRELVNVYLELYRPKYTVWGNWPNRDDWMHDPSFYDKGSDAWGYLVELKYKYMFKPGAEFIIGANWEYIKVENADTTLFFADGRGMLAGEEFIPNSILHARWYNVAVFAGLGFKL